MSKNCRICIEWQEHCYWNHMHDEKKHFLKTMVGDFTQSLSIPVKFVNNFNGNLSEVIKLKSPSGETWNIGVANETDELVLQFGWREFVSVHHIEEGDNMFFRYSGASSFDVLIFDSSGCEKIPCLFGKKDGWKRTENSVRIPKVPPSYISLSETEDSTTQSPPSGKNDELEATPNHDIGRNLSCCAGKEICEVKQENDLDSEESDTPNDFQYYFCKNGPVSEYHLTDEDKEEIASIRVPVHLSNPVYVTVMHPSHIRDKSTGVVGVPSEFAAKYLRTRVKEIVLQRADNRGKWHVQYLSTEYYRGLRGRRWNTFVRANGLRKHDVCLFELMRDKKQPTLTVHVLRRVHGRFTLLRK